jgi:hypothetical protein
MTGLPSRLLQTVAHGLWAAVLLAYLAYALIFGIYAAALFHFPFDYDQGEGFELLDAIYFARGQWPYRDIEAYPFYASNYPPRLLAGLPKTQPVRTVHPQPQHLP